MGKESQELPVQEKVPAWSVAYATIGPKDYKGPDLEEQRRDKYRL